MSVSKSSSSTRKLSIWSSHSAACSFLPASSSADMASASVVYENSRSYASPHPATMSSSVSFSISSSTSGSLRPYTHARTHTRTHNAAQGTQLDQTKGGGGGGGKKA